MRTLTVFFITSFDFTPHTKTWLRLVYPYTRYAILSRLSKTLENNLHILPPFRFDGSIYAYEMI